MRQVVHVQCQLPSVTLHLNYIYYEHFNYIIYIYINQDNLFYLHTFSSVIPLAFLSFQKSALSLDAPAVQGDLSRY